METLHYFTAFVVFCVVFVGLPFLIRIWRWEKLYMTSHDLKIDKWLNKHFGSFVFNPLYWHLWSYSQIAQRVFPNRLQINRRK